MDPRALLLPKQENGILDGNIRYGIPEFFCRQGLCLQNGSGRQTLGPTVPLFQLPRSCRNLPTRPTAVPHPVRYTRQRMGGRYRRKRIGIRGDGRGYAHSMPPMHVCHHPSGSTNRRKRSPSPLLCQPFGGRIRHRLLSIGAGVCSGGSPLNGIQLVQGVQLAGLLLSILHHPFGVEFYIIGRKRLLRPDRRPSGVPPVKRSAPPDRVPFPLAWIHQNTGETVG